jgi:hypothetical protein
VKGTLYAPQSKSYQYRHNFERMKRHERGMAEMPLTYCVDRGLLFATRRSGSRRKLPLARENECHEKLLAGRILPSW